ncbi:MAG TPA: metal-binding protein [Deltaproteobacteria bacterium]|nr:metal-binding protein [Deltaproteobacteria bacterium]
MSIDACNCAGCAFADRVCRVPGGKSPVWCPTTTQEKIVAEAVRDYADPEVAEFARAASVQEGECYANRDERPYVMQPVKTRLQELIEFSRRMGYKRLGMAFCGGLANEAAVLARILKAHGFEVISVTCKVGGVPKETIGIRDEEKIYIGKFEPMCNPISQARILNAANTDFNVMLGLCIGHDALFLRHVKGLSTVFAVKDRVMGHNPMAALYTSRSYYRRLAKVPVGSSERGPARTVSEGKRG